MGLFDNIIQRVATEIAKAAPAPTVTPVTEAQLQAAQNTGYGNSAGLTRNPMWSNVPFGSGQPIIPGAINPVRDDGRPDPRRYEYQVAQNINITPTRLVPFTTLRAAGDQIDILRRCIEVLKNKMVGLDWDIVLGEDAAEKVMAETGEKSFNRAMSIAKENYTEEINRLKQFWEVPDVSNGLIFSDWLNMALEDILVLDAWAVWPQKTVGGDLKGLQLLDGSTIKPLIDDRGMRPQAPYPAFQQILFGFPRSEFSAPEESMEADGEFSSDELAYLVRNRRTNTLYGYSPVERSLPIADIYLRAQQFLRAEYTDGVIPELMLKSDGTFTPDQLRAYENVLNDYLSGQTEQRKRANIIPAGLDPIAMEGYAEKFKADMHDFLITQICGHFGVQPSEIGMSPKGGLGGAGHQTGQAASSEVIGLIPLSNWVGKMLSQLSYVFLGMPRELEFKFMPSARTDEALNSQVTDVSVKNGTMTRNEARAKMGLPLLDAVEADQPIIETAAGTFLMTEDGLQPLAPAQPGQDEAPIDGENAPSPISGEAEADKKPDTKPVGDETDAEAEPVKEVKKFNDAHDESGRFTSGDGGGSGDNTHNAYEGSHNAPSSESDVSVNLSNIEQNMPNVLDPTRGPQLYRTGDAKSDAESFSVIHSLTGDPNQMVTIYRAVPAGVGTINNGDWVTLSPSYAAQHNESNLNGQGHVIQDQARVADLWTDGDSINEFGLDRSNNKSADTYVQARDEIRKFKKWLRKSPTKPFNFEFVPDNYAETLNKFVAVEDFEGARWFADRWL